MNDADWRSRVRWVVVHPDRPEVLALEQAGGLALPETELPAKVWTPRPPPSSQPCAAFQHHDQAMVAGVLDELAGEPAGPGRAPWAARWWFQAAEGWLRGTLDTLGNAATGPVQQVQVWELSCILRAPTTAGDVWFKASRDLPLFATRRPSSASWPGCSPTTCPPPGHRRRAPLDGAGRRRAPAGGDVRRARARGGRRPARAAARRLPRRVDPFAPPDRLRRA
jgi:hypothetical protein